MEAQTFSQSASQVSSIPGEQSSGAGPVNDEATTTKENTDFSSNGTSSPSKSLTVAFYYVDNYSNLTDPNKPLLFECSIDPDECFLNLTRMFRELMAQSGIHGIQRHGYNFAVFRPQHQIWTAYGDLGAELRNLWGSWDLSFASMADETGKIKMAMVNISDQNTYLSAREFKRYYRPETLGPEDDPWCTRFYRRLSSFVYSILASLPLRTETAGSNPSPESDGDKEDGSGQPPSPTTTSPVTEMNTSPTEQGSSPNAQPTIGNSLSFFSNSQSENRRRQGWERLENNG